MTRNTKSNGKKDGCDTDGFVRVERNQWKQKAGKVTQAHKPRVMDPSTSSVTLPVVTKVNKDIPEENVSGGGKDQEKEKGVDKGNNDANLEGNRKGNADGLSTTQAHQKVPIMTSVVSSLRPHRGAFVQPIQMSKNNHFEPFSESDSSGQEDDGLEFLDEKLMKQKKGRPMEARESTGINIKG